MNERERESAYFGLCLIAGVVSALLVYEIVRDGTRPDFHPGLFVGVLAIGFFLPFILELLFVLARSRGVRIWVSHPYVQTTHRLRDTVDSVEGSILDRAHRYGFATEVTRQAGKVEVRLLKAQRSGQVHGFLDHGFQGTVGLNPGAFGIDIEGALTFNDTLIFDTGETAKTQSLCDYLSLMSDRFVDESVSLVLYQATSIAIFSTLVAAFVGLLPGSAPPWIFSASLASVGMLAFVVFAMLRDTRHLFGWRLVWSSLLLATVPWAAYVVSFL